MSYNSRNLSVLAYANNFTMWHYVTDDKLDDIKQQGYFDKADILFRENDLIILNTKDHNTSVWVTRVKTPIIITEDTKVMLK